MFTGFNLRKLVIFTLTFVLAVGFSVLVFQGGADSFDAQIQQVVFDQGREGLVSDFYRVFAHLGDWYIYTGACLILLYFKETRFSYGFPLSFVSVLSVIVQLTVKSKVMRARPDKALWLINVHAQYSYPSGHTLASALFFGMLIKLIYYYAENDGKTLHFYATPHPPKRYIKRTNFIAVAFLACLLMIYLIGFARMYTGVHWPMDVIGSWAMAACILSLM